VQESVILDLDVFCKVMPANYGSTVTIGTGAKWIDVYKKLDEHGPVVMGGNFAGRHGWADLAR
jgi:hypothetical protein